jgi:3-oxoacyl-[acyl-carrier-protein] synthase-1/3-oxoacyl-[acyl-carrier-protein] synthase II
MGCICAAGDSLPRCIDTLFRGAPVPAPPVRFASNHPTRYPVFEVHGFPEEPGLLRTAALGIRAAREALSDAGLDAEGLRPLRVGVCVGTTVGCALSDETFCRDYRGGGTPSLAPIERIVRSNPAEAVAEAFGLSGPCETVVNACSSGTDAIGVAAAWIRQGICDAAVAGGADELGRVPYMGFAALMISDSSPCRPFDRDRRGLNLGEGAAMVVLESEALLRSRRKAPRAFVLGYGLSADAYHPTAPRPDGAGLRRAIAAALGEAGASPSDVAFVNAHGTGTPDNDRIESLVLAETLPGVPFVSTKGYTGHTLGAAGAIEAVFTVACLEAGRIPANAGLVTTDPEMRAFPVTEATAVRGSVALSESLAFGGNNAVVVLATP